MGNLKSWLSPRPSATPEHTREVAGGELHTRDGSLIARGLSDATTEHEMPAALQPPSRITSCSTDEALSLPSVYRCVSILTTVMSSMDISAMRNGQPVDPPPPLIRRPEIANPRRVTIASTMSSMAIHGEAIWYHPRPSMFTPVDSLRLLDPNQVSISREPSGQPRYDVWDSMTGRWIFVPSWHISHLKLMRVPGRLRGLGPLQATAAMLRGQLDLAAYASEWWTDGASPTGILKTEQVLNKDLAESYRQRWMESQRTRQVAVLGSGLSYEDSKLAPKDALFVEVSAFNDMAVARSFGIPTTLLDVNFMNDSGTYANVEQKSQALLDYTLSHYIGEIESAWSELLPLAVTAKFNTDDLTRLDPAVPSNTSPPIEVSI